MSRTGLVLSTLAEDSPNSDLWEYYNLVMLPDPDPNNTNNMGLGPDSSWVGARIQWGSPRSSGPGGNESPYGPYDRETDNGETGGFGELKLFTLARLGGSKFGIDLYDPFYHSDLYHNVPNTLTVREHPWAVIGQDILKPFVTDYVEPRDSPYITVPLQGDIVVFPGATLTILPGTDIGFDPGQDRYKFRLGDDGLADIFVYGTLDASMATESDSILFQLNGNGRPGSTEAWGGIHVMGGGRVLLNKYTRISGTRRGKPTNLTATIKGGRGGQIELIWTNPTDRSIPQWEYQQKEGSADWGPWMPIPGSIWSTFSHTVEGLTSGVSYQFKVRGLNRTDLAESEPSAAVTLTGIEGPTEVSFAENSDSIVGTYSIDGNYTWSLSGAGDHVSTDDDLFEINSLGQLRFSMAPDFEAPADEDGDNVYHVQVRAVPSGNPPPNPPPLDRAEAPPIPIGQVTVTVTNVEEVGVVSLSGMLPPEVGEQVSAALMDPDEDVTEMAWQWQRQAPGATEWVNITDATAAAYSPVAGDVEHALRATVRYLDGASTDATDRKDAASDPTAAVQGTLSIIGSQDIEFAEVVSGETRSLELETYTVTGGASATWSLEGVDKDEFTLSGGVLSFATGPDYEAPADNGQDNIYNIVVEARASGQTATLVVEVEITNADDPGVVTLSSTQPEVDEPIRATLTDPDGSVEHVRWSWLYFSSEDSQRNGEPTVVSSSDELIPSGVLMGLRLQARALYADGHGTHQSAESVQTEPVRGVPSAPQNLTATPSDGSLVLAWDAPSLAGYPAFSGYRYRYKTTAGTGWQPSATGALVEQTTRPMLEGLTHGKEYTVEVWAVNAQGAGPSATTTATPPSPDTPGRVELTSRRPRVGVPLTATLVDPDAPVRVRRWQWLQSPWYYRSAGDSSLVAPSEERYPELASYEPTVPALGRRLRAVVDYTDQYGPQSAQSAWTAPVLPGRPEAPALSAIAGDGQVALTWTAAADQGAAIVRYQYHRSDKPSGWLDVPGDGLDGHYTVGGLTNDADYTFKVRAVNAVGEGSPSNAVTATPQGPADPNPHAPAIAGPEEVWVAEGHTGALADADYTTSDDDGDEVTLTLTDAARGPFSLSSSGTLQVTSALDYESDRTSYEVTLTATDDGEPSKSSTKQVTVTVDNVDEVGTVTLSSSSPQVGDHLTATLTDPDGGIRNVSWSWQDIPRSDESDDAEPPRTTSYPYTVEASDEGRRIEVQARYTDAHGSGKSARAITEVVQEAAESNRHAPAIAGPEEVWVAEGHTGALADADYTTSDDDGDEVTLTLTDAARGPFSLSSSGTLHVTSALDYERDDTSYEVTLTATDDGEPSKSSTKQVTVTVDNVDEVGTVTLSSSSPQVGDHLTATLSDPDGGIRNVSWSWQDIPRSDESDDAEPPQTTSYPYTVEASDEGRRIEVRASYTDAHGSGKTARATTEVVQEAAESNRHAPAIAGPEEVSVAEGHTGALADADYTTSDGDGDAVTLTLTDAARGPFSLSSSGTLHVTSALDYESDDTRYEVTLTATDDGEPSKSSTKQVTVTMTNQEEEGTVRLSSSQPQVGVPITARLSDPDGNVDNVRWSWLYFSSEDGSRNGEPTVVASSDELIPSPVLVGLRLQARALYDDGQGPNKSAESVQTEPVQEAAESNRYEPAIAGPEEVSVAEGHTGALADADYTTSDDDGDEVTLTLSATGDGLFSLNSSGELRITECPRL